MSIHKEIAPRGSDPKLAQIIKLAVMAVGGQGGGVLTGWIEKMARAQGYAVQATSVAGVAQRTGATIYYVEMAPQKPGEARSSQYGADPEPWREEGVELPAGEAGEIIARGESVHQFSVEFFPGVGHRRRREEILRS